MSLKQIAINALRTNRLRVMAGKAVRRLETDTQVAATAWARDRAQPIDAFCEAHDPKLWQETLSFMAQVNENAKPILASIPYDLGGGGAYSLLYFLTRHQRPSTVVETGVAAGWSSVTILEALKTNGNGKLYSSDFPYFRLPNPERFIGILVPDDLRGAWHLDTRGDDVALPAILARCGPIDLFHYDSDKSYAGRRKALDTVVPQLNSGATIMVDDIQDNLFFRDWVEERGLQFSVFEFGGKFVGLVDHDG